MPIINKNYRNLGIKLIFRILRKFRSAFMDLVPIILVVGFFQIIVLRQPFPNVLAVIYGAFLVVLGLMLFIECLEMGLFPIGESMAYALAKKGSLFWLLFFSFALGFSTTIAEPALIAIAAKAGQIFAEEGLIEANEGAISGFALGLRITVAFSVGFALITGVMRILKGWSIAYLIISGYAIVLLLTLIAPKEIIGIAYDSGGVTTSTVTVPLVAALGVGLSSVIKGRSPMLDGFGLIAFASLFPMIFVLVYGMVLFNV
jgi:hypothetical protein